MADFTISGDIGLSETVRKRVAVVALALATRSFGTPKRIIGDKTVWRICLHIGLVTVETTEHKDGATTV